MFVQSGQDLLLKDHSLKYWLVDQSIAEEVAKHLRIPSKLSESAISNQFIGSLFMSGISKSCKNVYDMADI